MKDIVLHQFQDESVEALRENIRRGVKNQVLSAATGSGKTVIGSFLLDECLNKGKRGIFVCDRVSLVDQTSAMLDDYGVPHGVIQAQHWRWQPHQKIQVASAATLEKRGWPDAHLIIVDEAHTVRKHVANRIAKRDCITIGLTATPFTRGLGKLYDAVVTVTTTNKLIADGFLCPFHVYAASEPDMTGAKVTAGEWADDVAAERAMPIVGDCVTEYLKHADGKKFIAFGCNVAHCEELQKQFLAAGVQCALYTYRTPDEARADMVKEFKRADGYIKGLISVSALAKGFDAPTVEAIIMARPLKSSLAEHIQILGRGLRSDKANPDKQCIVLDHAGNMIRFWNQMQDFFEVGASKLDEGKRKDKKPREPNEKKPVKCPKCFHVHFARPSCPSCGFEYPRRSNVEHEAGELVSLDGKSGMSLDEKQALWSQLLCVVRERGYKEGWAAHKYKTKVGVWPRGLADVEAEPSPGLMRWLKSEQIRWAKRRKPEQQVAA